MVDYLTIQIIDRVSRLTRAQASKIVLKLMHISIQAAANIAFFLYSLYYYEIVVFLVVPNLRSIRHVLEYFYSLPVCATIQFEEPGRF